MPDPFNPQSLNRYSYVYNNPLKYVDRSGHNPLWQEYVAEALALMEEEELAEEIYGMGVNPIVLDPPTPEVQQPTGGSIVGPLLFIAHSIINPGNLVNTVLGTATGSLGGGEPRFHQRGVLIFENVGGKPGEVLRSFISPDSEQDTEMAVVVGRAILNTGEFSEDTDQGAKWLAHEYCHTVQSEALRVAYLPTYGFLNLLYPYGEHPMEKDAREYSNKYWKLYRKGGS